MTDSQPIDLYIQSIDAEAKAVICSRQQSGFTALFEERYKAWRKANSDALARGEAVARERNMLGEGRRSVNARWGALTRYLDDPALPIDNNFDHQQIRPWATGQKNWLFAGTLLTGQRAAAIMSLIQTAKLNGHNPYAYLRNVLTRLPTQLNSDLGNLLPHRRKPRD